MDRAEVHDIYREWNAVFNEYRPARFAVGEAWVIPHQHLYAREGELGQVFNFEFAKANWNAAAFKVAIEDGIRSAHDAESTTTWVMSNHDVVRHASRYGLPQVHRPSRAAERLAAARRHHIHRRPRPAAPCRAAILMELGLPGSVYVYQGEELFLKWRTFRGIISKTRSRSTPTMPAHRKAAMAAACHCHGVPTTNPGLQIGIRCSAPGLVRVLGRPGRRFGAGRSASAAAVVVQAVCRRQADG
ncbi:alpha-amylase family glycosyl hydrolase [Bifidobacterium animalis]|uniref:alpha-amylase family glycosyl hydrolase n=1 Tax=Bifidobacterium animalis TaxID=28025 RepID=UPI0022656AFB|nr:alpha-amylase family glycosyl hydrolase [Bifidobacterium animalis]